jgi:hypothetical protein
MQQQGEGAPGYEFSAAPRVMQPKSKFREDQNQPQAQPVDERIRAHFNNLMFDRRVVRGSTYAAVVTTTKVPDLPTKSIKPRVLRATQQQRQQMAREPQAFGARNVSTPPPIDGRVHVAVETDELVEILTDKPPLYEVETQTEALIAKPPKKLFMPVKTGTDIGTQIGDMDLFDFDVEVEPILRSLLGKTLELSRMEVLEEEELRRMKQEQENLQNIRNQETAEVHALEEKERRAFEENVSTQHEFLLMCW